jgi:hypothetical protein
VTEPAIAVPAAVKVPEESRYCCGPRSSGQRGLVAIQVVLVAGRSRWLDAWTAGRPVIPYDARIAGLWGELAGQAQLRGRPRLQSHTWIAACCLRYQVPLMALDPAGFCDFAKHHGLVLLSGGMLPGPRGPQRREQRDRDKHQPQAVLRLE